MENSKELQLVLEFVECLIKHEKLAEENLRAFQRSPFSRSGTHPIPISPNDPSIIIIASIKNRASKVKQRIEEIMEELGGDAKTAELVKKYEAEIRNTFSNHNTKE